MTAPGSDELPPTRLAATLVDPLGLVSLPLRITLPAEAMLIAPVTFAVLSNVIANRLSAFTDDVRYNWPLVMFITVFLVPSGNPGAPFA